MFSVVDGFHLFSTSVGIHHDANILSDRDGRQVLTEFRTDDARVAVRGDDLVI